MKQKPCMPLFLLKYEQFIDHPKVHTIPVHLIKKLTEPHCLETAMNFWKKKKKLNRKKKRTKKKRVPSRRGERFDMENIFSPSGLSLAAVSMTTETTKLDTPMKGECLLVCACARTGG